MRCFVMLCLCMLAHILLGRPWQYDRRVTHDGFKNMYSFVKDSKTIKLCSFDSKTSL
jgi:hypothetical protein